MDRGEFVEADRGKVFRWGALKLWPSGIQKQRVRWPSWARFPFECCSHPDDSKFASLEFPPRASTASAARVKKRESRWSGGPSRMDAPESGDTQHACGATLAITRSISAKWVL